MPWVFKISHHEPIKDANGKKIGRKKVVLTDKNGNEKPGAYVEWMDAKGAVWAASTLTMEPSFRPILMASMRIW